MLFVLPLAACATRGAPAPADVPAPREPVRAPSPSPAEAARAGGAVAGVDVSTRGRPTASAWRFAWAGGARQYDVVVEASVEDQGREQERVVTRSLVTTELEPTASGVAVRGSVDALAVEASERVTGGAAAEWEPVRFAGAIDARSVRVSAADPGAELRCGTPIPSAVAVARETVPRIPAGTLTVGMRWQDSTVVTSCRSLVPTTARTLHSYEVVSAEFLDSGAEVLRIRRRTITRTQGRGLARGRPTTVTGTADSDAALLVEPGAGRLVAIDADTRATLTVTLPEGARSFVQTGRVTVRGR